MRTERQDVGGSGSSAIAGVDDTALARRLQTAVDRIDPSHRRQQLPTVGRYDETEPTRVLPPSKEYAFMIESGALGRYLMGPYDSRRLTLDPGLTALTLHALRSRDGHYPFIERHARSRRLQAALRQRLAAWFPTIRTLLTARPTTS